MKWQGVMPALTTTFDRHLDVDSEATVQHALRMLACGCSGLIVGGSLGGGATLTKAEKLDLIARLQAAGCGAPIVGTVSALSTAEARSFAKDAEAAGCAGLMILPPYVYKGDWREMRSYLGEILSSTSLPCMLYNNPVAYGVDFLPEQIAELAHAHPNLAAVKESSADVRRIAALRALLDDRLALLVGVDDAILEAMAMGAVGWVAGLVNAFPVESVRLFEYARMGMRQEAFDLYRWFLPLLRMDTVPKFVQLIKLAEDLTGEGNRRVRAPRLELAGEELAQASATLEEALRRRPKL